MVKRRLAGTALALFCTAATLVVYAAWVVSGSIALRIVTLPVILGLGVAFHLAHRLRKRSAVDVVARDARRPVLYLRPFHLDATPIRRPGVSLQLLVTLPFPWETAKVVPRLTLEEALVSIFEGVGPVVALGHPDNPVEPAGSARTYAGDDWEARVEELAQQSSAIVIVPEARASVVWELGALRDMGALQRLVVIPHPDLEWDALRAEVDFLPEINERTALIWFDDNGSHLVEAKSARMHHRLSAVRKYALDRLRAVPRGGARRIVRSLALFAWVVVLPSTITGLIAIVGGVRNPAVLAAAWLTAVFVAAASTSWIPMRAKLGLGLAVDPIRTYRPLHWAWPRYALLGVLGIVLLFRAFVLETFVVTNSSMSPAYEIGDSCIVKKSAYRAREPRVGDIVVFTRGGQAYLKRIAATAGERVLVGSTEIDVPPAHVYVLGDNRDNSVDSRLWGPVPNKDLLGTCNR